jgi:predicted NBD/HSP70 family sugar kinase
MSGDWVIGIDLGASKIACALVSPENTLTARAGMETRARDGPAAAVRRMCDSVRELLTWAPAGARVAGYSAYLVELDKEVQDEIIRRTEYGS